MHPLLNIAIQAARSASKLIMQFYDRLDRLQVEVKQQNDFVTNVDRIAEQEIIRTIQKSYPLHTIISEEAGLIPGNDCCWLIDPIDGTTNFIHGIPHFSISIAAKRQEQLEIGLVFDPIRNELFTAARGEGAQLNQRRIRVSSANKLMHSVIGTGFTHMDTQQKTHYFQTLQRLHEEAASIRRAGSAALDLAYVAAGRFDGFFEYALKPWDIAAGALLIKEAGGIITDPQGSEQFLQSGHIVAATPLLYPLLKQVFQ